MADHPNVRRLKGQPDRWRNGVARERWSTSLRTLGGWDGAIATMFKTADAYQSIGQQVALAVADLRAWFERVDAALRAAPRPEVPDARVDA